MDAIKIKRHPRDSAMVELYTVDHRGSVNVWAVIHEDLFLPMLSPGNRKVFDANGELNIDLRVTTASDNSELFPPITSLVERWEKEVDDYDKQFDFGRGGRDDGGYDDGRYSQLNSCIDDIYEILPKG